MGYISRRGRPPEYASKISHGSVISDHFVKDFLSHCNIPKRAEEITIPNDQRYEYHQVSNHPIDHIIAVDGGYEEIPVQIEFPSATICFFQFGALTFTIEDLEQIGNQPFIKPEDMSRLKQIQRYKLTLPIRNVTLKSQDTITNSIRSALYDFFNQRTEQDDERLIDTLCWLIFHEYDRPIPKWVLGSCPHCGTQRIPFNRHEMSREHTFRCPSCQGELFLTDVFRLHEAIDNEMGAGGILGYVTTTLEQIILFHVIRLILKIKPALLHHILFIKDGPLAFFGQTANMHKPARKLVQFLFANHNLYLTGLEKSGPFVEHADEISDTLNPGTVLLLNNDYIYKYIIPGKANPANPYGRTTYYSHKLIFKTMSGGIHVASLPATEINPNPGLPDYQNLDVILTHIEKLKCDMYDNALLPVALANKLVSLAQVPSSRILQRFAVTVLGK